MEEAFDVAHNKSGGSTTGHGEWMQECMEAMLLCTHALYQRLKMPDLLFLLLYNPGVRELVSDAHLSSRLSHLRSCDSCALEALSTDDAPDEALAVPPLEADSAACDAMAARLFTGVERPLISSDSAPVKLLLRLLPPAPLPSLLLATAVFMKAEAGAVAVAVAAFAATPEIRAAALCPFASKLLLFPFASMSSDLHGRSGGKITK
jgi:hypothetical protein